MMKDTYLEVTYRHGRPLAAYLYLPRKSGDVSCTTRRVEHGMLVDFSKDGEPIGIEITAPAQISAAWINEVLERLGQKPLGLGDLAPLVAA
jgi:uncharacterized protein YuzE